MNKSILESINIILLRKTKDLFNDKIDYLFYKLQQKYLHTI